jgi:hypothetical protein
MRRTTVFGFNMASQAARRRLVVAAYTVLAVLILSGWLLDRLHTTGVYIYFAAWFISYFVFGGYGSSGMIKPFNGKAPRVQPMPSSFVELQLRSTGALDAPDPEDYRNDEREVERRDRVHYQAYQGICVLLALIWFLAMWELHPPHFLPAALVPVLLYLLALPAVLLAVTLPQAILLWTEPDLEPAFEDRIQAATPSRPPLG